MAFMLKRSFFLILSLITVLFMSTVRYDGNQTINQQLAAAGAVAFPSFLLPAEVSSAYAVKSFLKEGISLEDVLEDREVPGLRDQENVALEQELKHKLNANPVWRKLIRDKRMSVGVVDMTNESDVKYAALNGRHMMYAASLPKIAVLAAAHDAITVRTSSSES